MFAFFHWLVLSIAVRLPRVLPAHVAQQLLVRFGAAVPRDDWRNYSVCEIYWQQNIRSWVVEMHAWNYGCLQMAGCNETNPVLAYLWRCVSPFEVCVAEFMDAVDSTYGADMRAQDAEREKQEVEWARQEAEWAKEEAAWAEHEAMLDAHDKLVNREIWARRYR